MTFAKFKPFPPSRFGKGAQGVRCDPRSNPSLFVKIILKQIFLV